MTAEVLVLVHGYTLADLDACAKAAVRVVGPIGMDVHDRYDLAYSAAAEHLYAAKRPPQWRAVMAAGRDAIYAAAHEHRRDHGYFTGDASAGAWSSSAFWRYWSSRNTRGLTPDTDRVVEHLALAQVLAELSERDRQILTHLATTDYRTTADAMGLTRRAAYDAATRARTRALALWYDHETPPTRQRGPTVRRRRPTTPLAPCGTLAADRRHRRRQEPVCEACRAACRVAWRARRANR